MIEASRGDTIFALSSGAPPAAIAIVRVSGPAAGIALHTLAGRLPEPRRATLAPLRDAAGDLLDRALLLWFPGPETATGEDLGELHLHGGRAVVASVLAALARVEGCRPAEAGEFTRRAFLNGRLDLAEAEGLADLLSAETETARRHALRLAEGGLSRRIEQWRARLLMLSARAEAVLEFGDDEGDVLPDPTLIDDISAIRDEFAQAIAQPPAERLRDGFRVVVAGPPNAGKSSLINALSGRDAAIASPEPGTTRDLIEVPVMFDGLPILLIDSAGLRDTDQMIERMGIERAEQAMDRADLVLWLGEPAEAPEGALTIHSKADLPERSVTPVGVDLIVSVMNQSLVDEVRARIAALIVAFVPASDTLLLNLRQSALLHEAVVALGSVETLALPELVAEQLRIALRSMDRVTGRSDVEAMLDSLFGQFCIGK